MIVRTRGLEPKTPRWHARPLLTQRRATSTKGAEEAVGQHDDGTASTRGHRHRRRHDSERSDRLARYCILDRPLPHAITAAPASAALSGKRSGDGPGRRWGGVLAPPRAGIEPTDARAGLGRTRARWPRPSDSRWTSPSPTPCEHPLQMALQRPGRAVGRRVGRPEGRGPRGPSRGRLGWLGRCPSGLLGSSSTDLTVLVTSYSGFPEYGTERVK